MDANFFKSATKNIRIQKYLLIRVYGALAIGRNFIRYSDIQITELNGCHRNTATISDSIIYFFMTGGAQYCAVTILVVLFGPRIFRSVTGK